MSPGRSSPRASFAGYSRSVAAYQRGRPGYPPAAVDFLAARLRLGPGRTVVDLAAGTGKLTRPLLATGAEVVAVEPVAEMRAVLPAGARAVDGTAEAMPLTTESADAVVVAQAFHWFDGDAALAEIHRVLRPGGSLALVWNRRRMEDPLNQAIEELLAPYRGHMSALHTGDWHGAFEGTELFGPLEGRAFPNDQSMDADGLADRIASVNFIAAIDEAERTKVVRAARALAGPDGVTIRQDTEVLVTGRRGERAADMASETLLEARERSTMAYTREQVREAVERAGDEQWQALIRHHEDAYPASRPTPGDVCRAEAERLNQLGLGDAEDLELVETRVERTDSTVRIVHLFEYGPQKVRLLTEPMEGYGGETG